MNGHKIWVSVMAWLGAAAVTTAVAVAQDATPFYKGKTVTIVVGTSAGGGYDTYARLLGRYLGKHIPGNPDVVVSNMPGGGSKVAAGYVARIAPKDGTFIAAPYATEPLAPILEDKSGLNYDPNTVNYLGSAASDDYLCIVRSDASATTFEDMFKTQIVLGGVAETSETGYLPILLNNLLGTKFKVVLGYPGSSEIMLAVQKKEIDGMCGLGWTSLEAQYPAMLRNGEIKIFLQENNQGLPELNKRGVPLSISYARDDEQRRILEIINSQEIYSRPYFVAAEVPADRLQGLRRAFLETWHDPELMKDAANMHLDVGPSSGEDVQALLRKVYANPSEILEKAKEAIKLKH
jgi:tripartite-type tricarboxylate transporter receptor subunit TctC